MSLEAYKIAVKLSLINNVSAGLVALSSQFVGLNKHVSGTNAGLTAMELRLASIKRMGLIGGAMAGVGFGALMMFKGPLEEAKKFEQQMGKLKLFGMTDAQNSEAVNFAKNMNIMGSSARENLKLMTEAQGVFRESGMTGSHALEGAKLAAPFLAKIAFASSSLDEESQAKMKTSSLAMLRYIEMSGGLNSPQDFNRLANQGWKLTQTSGGAVNFEQLRQYKARAGVAGQYLTEDAMAMMEPIIGELKGSTAGFSSRTAFNRLNGIIKVPNQVASELLKSGIWDANKVTLNGHGGIKSFNGNPLKDSELMMRNPVEFYGKYFKPMYDAQNTSPEERGRKNAMFFGSTGGQMYTLIDKQWATIQRSLQAYHTAKGVDDSVSVAGGTLAGKEVDLHAKWKTVMLELGTVVLPLAIKAVEGLTTVLRGAISFAREFPTLTKGVVLAFGSLAALVAVGGTLMLAKAGFAAVGLALQVGGGMGSMLMSAAGGFGAMAKAGGVFMAAYAGWKVGGLLNDYIINPAVAAISGRKGETLGGGLYELLNGDPMAPKSGTVRRGYQSGSAGQGNVYLDGNKVGKHVAAHMGREAGRPSGGTSRPDPGIAMASVGAVGGW
jgi:hypothetical protein